MALEGTFDEIRNATTFATSGDHADALEAAPYKNADQTNAKSDTGFITAGSSAPTGTTEAGVAIPYAGVGWQDTNAVTDGPSQVTKVYNGAASAFYALAQAIYSSSAPSSAYERPSVLWRDTTLHLWRRYESATTSPDGVAGWHPISEAWQLWRNESGGTIPKGAVVVHKADGAVQRAIDTTMVPRNPKVVGVTAETITNNGYGVLATIAGGAQIQCLISVATYGTGDKGDALVASDAAGYARQAGPLGGSLADASHSFMGLQQGAFAELLSQATVTGLHPVRLLGEVGRGLTVLHATARAIWDDATPPTAATAVDFSQGESGTSGAQDGLSSLVDAGHAPLVAVQGYLEVDGTDSAYSAIKLEMGKTSSAAGLELGIKSGDLSNPEYADTLAFPMLATAATHSGAAPGSWLYVKYTASAGSPSFTRFKLFRTAYNC